jgi:hypothetical protein
MQLKITLEAGYEQSLKFMSFSYLDEADDVDEWWENQHPKAIKRAGILASKSPEHAKFLRAIQVWVEIKATRAYWQEYATYKVGSTELSASTMHKLSKRRPEACDFSVNTPFIVIETFQKIWDVHKAGEIDFMALKDSLPEGYLQTRGVNLNYATLRNIIVQRKGHRYKYWDDLIAQVMEQIEHPELLEDLL